LSIPTIEDSKYRKTRHGNAKNIGQISGLKTGNMAAMRILEEPKNSSCAAFTNLAADLRASS